ncbi:hypothetical protein ABT336_04080 [Micromonospora sp. NPDC000207]|uniref:hypothetical protein n=1 Tax=Micromonospora sp. NPDC000207 TaxID=3154246 RepID=UPI003330E0BD
MPTTRAVEVSALRAVGVSALRAVGVPGTPRRPARRLAAQDTAEGWPVRDRS